MAIKDWVIGAAASVVLVPTALVVTAIAYIGLNQIKNARHYYQTGCNIPYRKGRPILGNYVLGNSLRDLMDPKEKHGPVNYRTIFHLPMIIVSDPDLIQHVLLKENFPKGKLVIATKELFGQNLVSMQHGEGNPWKKERKLADPAFRVSHLRKMRDIFAHHAIAFTQRLIDSKKQGSESFNFADDICKVTLDVISHAGFGYDMLAAENAKSSSIFMNALQQVFKIGGNPLFFLPYGPSIVKWQNHDNLATVDKVFYDVIDQRLKNQREGKMDSNRLPDLLDMLLQPDENGDQLTREQLRNELLLFYFAGHDTTSTCLSWTLYELCLNPEVYQTLMQEIDSVMGVPKDGKIEAPTTEQLDQLVYTKMVLNESLRLHPPVTGIPGRTIPETTEIKGYIFPKGVQVVCSATLTHRNEQIWPNPEKFDPQRFTKENSEGRSLFAFLPFSAGPRICIGKNFFYIEATTILVTLLRSLRFELDTTKKNGVVHFTETLNKPDGIWLFPSLR